MRSAAAFQSARALERAIEVFGSLSLTEEVPNPILLSSGAASPNQQKFVDALLAEHAFVLTPSAVSRHSWSVLVSFELAAGKYRVVRQERFGLDTRLVKG